MNTLCIQLTPRALVLRHLTDDYQSVYRLCESTGLWPHDVREALRHLVDAGWADCDRGKFRDAQLDRVPRSEKKTNPPPAVLRQIAEERKQKTDPYLPAVMSSVYCYDGEELELDVG